MTDTIHLVWDLFQKTGDPRYYMLYSGLCDCEKQYNSCYNQQRIQYDEDLSL